MSDVTLTHFTLKMDVLPKLYFEQQYEKLSKLLKKQLATELQISVFLHATKTANGQVYQRNQSNIRRLKEVIKEVNEAAGRKL